jgi:hypothetical protein
MSKLRYIILLILGLIIQVTVVRAQKVQPYKPMTEIEWNEAKKGFSDSLLLVIGKIATREHLVIEPNGEDPYFEEEDNTETALINQLELLANDSQLLVIQHYPNPIVRCYVFKIAFSEKKDFTSKILLNHTLDSALVNVYGTHSKSVFEYMLDKVTDRLTSYNPRDSSSEFFNEKWNKQARLQYYDLMAALETIITTPNIENYYYLSTTYKLLYDSNSPLKSFIYQEAFRNNNNEALHAILKSKNYCSESIEKTRLAMSKISQEKLNSVQNIFFSEEKMNKFSSDYKEKDKLDEINKLSKLCNKTELELLTEYPDEHLRLIAFETLVTKHPDNYEYIVLDRSFEGVCYGEDFKFYNIYQEHRNSNLSGVNDSTIATADLDSTIVFSVKKYTTLVDNLILYQPKTENLYQRLKWFVSTGIRWSNLINTITSYQKKDDIIYYIDQFDWFKSNNYSNLTINQLLNDSNFVANFLNDIEKNLPNQNRPFTESYPYNLLKNYPLPIFLPVLKKLLLNNLKDVHEEADILSVLSYYAHTPYKEEAKNIISLAYNNNLTSPHKKRGIINYTVWCMANITNTLPYFYYFDDKIDKEQFKLLYTKKELDSILWEIWEKHGIVNDAEYDYLKTHDSCRAQKLAKTLVMNLFSDTTNETYNNLLIYNITGTYLYYKIGYEIFTSSEQMPQEYLAPIKRKLAQHLKRGENFSYLLNFLLFYYKASNLEEVNQTILTPITKHPITKTELWTIAKYSEWFYLLNDAVKHSKWYNPDKYDRNSESTFRFDSLLPVKTHLNIDSILRMLWIKKGVIDFYILEYFNKTDRSFFINGAKHSLYQYVYNQPSLKINNNYGPLKLILYPYPDYLKSLFKEELNKKNPNIYALKKMISINRTEYQSIYLNFLINRIHYSKSIDNKISLTRLALNLLKDCSYYKEFHESNITRQFNQFIKLQQTISEFKKIENRLILISNYCNYY